MPTNLQQLQQTTTKMLTFEFMLKQKLKASGRPQSRKKMLGTQKYNELLGTRWSEPCKLCLINKIQIAFHV